jgi:4-carboxymuconolactone decarboxylase
MEHTKTKVNKHPEISNEEIATQMFGKEKAESIKESITKKFPDLAKHLSEVLSQIYSRPQLDLKTRELATVASLITLGYAQPQLKSHLYAALNVGWKKEELLELIMQMSLYVGYPAILNALNTADEVFREWDIENQ